ncbi:MAG: YncE family protein [Sulfurifustis sp.]
MIARPSVRRALRVFAFALLFPIAAGSEPPGLQLEDKIVLGRIAGRIDHLAVDLDRRRLFVAELGNDSVAVIDLKTRKLLRRLPGFKHPQGIGYDRASDLLFVASGGDGAVHLLRGEDFAALGRIDLGDDADNVRVDAGANRVYVGYGSGAIAIIDPRARVKIGNITLPAHPESFQLDSSSRRIYANVPDAKQVAVLDRESGVQIAAWQLPNARANFPLAIDGASRRVLVIARHPPKLIVFDSVDGSITAEVSVCGDADDVFVDAKRRQIYVSCGEGFVDVFEQHDSTYRRIGHMASVAGARTSLFVPELDRLFVAVRSTAAEPAALWVFRPLP